MSKKSLLEEGSVRQFMKLANLAPLSDGFINEKFVKEEEEIEENQDSSADDVTEGADEEVTEGVVDEEVTEGVVDEDVTDEVVKEEFAEEEEFGEEEAVLDAPLDAPAEEPPAAGGDIEGLVKAIADAISAHTGVEVAVSGDEAEAPLEEPGEEAEVEVGDVEMASAEVEPEEEAPAMRDYQQESLDDIVAEVTKRVKKRLFKSKK